MAWAAQAICHSSWGLGQHVQPSSAQAADLLSHTLYGGCLCGHAFLRCCLCLCDCPFPRALYDAYMVASLFRLEPRPSTTHDEGLEVLSGLVSQTFWINHAVYATCRPAAKAEARACAQASGGPACVKAASDGLSLHWDITLLTRYLPKSNGTQPGGAFNFGISTGTGLSPPPASPRQPASPRPPPSPKRSRPPPRPQ